MRKIIIYLISALLSISALTACNENNESNQKANPNHLEIAVYAKNIYLENVAQEYMNINKGVEIDIITYQPDIKSSVVGTDALYELATKDKVPENYVKAINTSLMAEKGSDIIQMDVLPYYKYAKSGYLLNLNDFLSKDKDMLDELYPKMVDAMRYDGGLYAIPMDYTAYLLAGIGDMQGSSIDELISNAQALVKSNGKATYLLKDVYSLFDILYEKNYPNLVNLQESVANFDSEDFIEILNECKKLSEEKMFPIKQNKDSESNTYAINYDSVWTQDLLMPYFTGEDIYPNRFLAKDINGDGYFTTSTSFGINKNSQNSELAWDFIKFMSSSKMQSMPSVFPINKIALDNGFKMDITQMLKDARLEKCDEVSSEYVKKIKAYSEQVSAFHFKDVIIENIVSQEVKKFFEGETTADETAEIIQQRVSLYFKE